MALKRKNVLGMSPVKPSNMTIREYQKLFKFWNKKLQDSGHNDVEDIFPSHDGSFTPFFQRDATSMTLSCDSSHALANYSNETEEYYRLCRTFLSHCDWRLEFYPRSTIYKYMFHMHTNGAAYNVIAKYLRGSRNLRADIREKYGTDYIKPHLLKGYSIFWIHSHVAIIIKRMFQWHKEHPEGLWNGDVAEE